MNIRHHKLGLVGTEEGEGETKGRLKLGGGQSKGGVGERGNLNLWKGMEDVRGEFKGGRSQRGERGETAKRERRGIMGAE